MANLIITGAYVIRKRKTSSVLHIKSTTLSDWAWVAESGQDEITYRDQQIWWIEPLPDQMLDGKDEVVYSITNTSSGRALSVKCGDGKTHMKGTTPSVLETYITASPEDGGPWQRWRIQKRKDGGTRAYYTIVSVGNGQAVSSDSESWSITQEKVAGCGGQHWELVTPVVSIPPGWFQIQNSKTGDILKHTYLSSPPILRPPQSPLVPPQYRESWGSQWALLHVKSYSPEFESTAINWPLCIINRLTKAFLSNTALGVTAWESKPIDIGEHIWKLELDSECNWRIIHSKTSFLLEQSQDSGSGGTEVVCVDEAWTGLKGWLLTSPVVKTQDGPSIPSTEQLPFPSVPKAPPMYDTSTD